MALASVSVFRWHAVTLVARVCISVVGLVLNNFLCSWGQHLLLQFMRVPFMCSYSSFTVRSVWGILLSF